MTAAGAAAAKRERLLSLDVFRGMTVAGMLLVNTPGTWSAIYPPLRHAEWHGWTPTDLVFPFFLFIVGITTQLSLSARRERGHDEGALRRQILKRAALIFLIGLLINGFPYFTWTAIPGNPDPSLVDRFLDRLQHWRIMGVLQRIGLAYGISAFIATRTSLRVQVITIAALLAGYWFVMTVIPVPGTGAPGPLSSGAATMAGYWDRYLLDWSRWGLGNHLWVGSVTWDPEGILSTTGAVATALVGNLAGVWIRKPLSLAERLNGMFAAGSLLMMLGLVWNWAFPINKNLWTGSYVLFTGGMAAITLATVMWMVDVRGWRSWTKFFEVYGLNPLVAFAGSGLMARLIYSVITFESDGRRVSLQAVVFQTFFASWLSPVNASLAFALAFVGFWFVLLYWLYRRGVILKV